MEPIHRDIQRQHRKGTTVQELVREHAIPYEEMLKVLEGPNGNPLGEGTKRGAMRRQFMAGVTVERLAQQHGVPYQRMLKLLEVPRGRPRPGTLADEIQREYQAGATERELAERHEMTYPCILKLLGISDPLTGKDEEIRTKYAAGQSLTSLGQEYDVSTRRIRRLLVDAGVPVRVSRRAKQLDPATVSSIIEEYVGGKTIAQVAEKSGVSYAIARCTLKEHSVPRRRGAPSIDRTAEDQLVLEEYQRQPTARAVADALKVPIHRVRESLKRQGIKLSRGHQPIDVDDVRLRELLEAGKTREQIAKELGVSRPTVVRRLRQLKKKGS